jgi:TetR/AcrR family transcriptional regulator, regulator of biofilm formation and stress response
VQKRRFDPERRDRIIDAALDVIAERGVNGTSHRTVAVRADVPLGSMTYHFESMDELLREAFTRFTEQSSSAFADRFRSNVDQDLAIAVEHVIDMIRSAPVRNLVLTYELYTLAAREPAFKAIVFDWMQRDRATFETNFDPPTARLLGALIEGLIIHQTFAPRADDQTIASTGVARIIDTCAARADPDHSVS